MLLNFFVWSKAHELYTSGMLFSGHVNVVLYAKKYIRHKGIKKSIKKQIYKLENQIGIASITFCLTSSINFPAFLCSFHKVGIINFSVTLLHYKNHSKCRIQFYKFKQININSLPIFCSGSQVLITIGISLPALNLIFFWIFRSNIGQWYAHRKVWHFSKQWSNPRCKQTVTTTRAPHQKKASDNGTSSQKDLFPK